MAYSAQTSNYGLPLPTGTDKSTWLDTNEGFQAVDAALAGAVAKGTTNEAAIEALATRMTSAEGGISQNATDIDALETRMTANEQVAGNALTGVAQLSEKVYSMNTAQITTIQEFINIVDTLTADELRMCYIDNVAVNAGTAYPDMTATAARNPLNIYPLATAQSDNSYYSFGWTNLNENIFSATSNIAELNWTIGINRTTSEQHPLHFSSVRMNTVIGNNGTPSQYGEYAEVSSFTLHYPTAVADD